MIGFSSRSATANLFFSVLRASILIAVFNAQTTNVGNDSVQDVLPAFMAHFVCLLMCAIGVQLWRTGARHYTSTGS